MFGLVKLAEDEEQKQKGHSVIGGLAGMGAAGVAGYNIGGHIGAKKGELDGYLPADSLARDHINGDYDKQVRHHNKTIETKTKGVQSHIQDLTNDADRFHSSADEKGKEWLEQKAKKNQSLYDEMMVDPFTKKHSDFIDYTDSMLAGDPRYGEHGAALFENEAFDRHKERHQKQVSSLFDHAKTLREKGLDSQEKALALYPELSKIRRAGLEEESKINKARHKALDNIHNHDLFTNTINKFKEDGRAFGAKRGLLGGAAIGLGAGALIGHNIKRQHKQE